MDELHLQCNRGEIRKSLLQADREHTRLDSAERLAKSQFANDIEAHKRESQYDINALIPMFANLLDERIDSVRYQELLL